MTGREARPRAVFFGTPDIAVPMLAALTELADVACVVTQPDRPAGRGMKLAAPPVKELAQRLAIPVVQPTKVRTPEFAAELRALGADVAVVVAYGRILPKAVLDAPRLGCVNVHASLLPKLRGAAPIQWAIARGEAVTGVCLMQMDEGMDTGPVLARAELAIGPDETAGELAPRLAQLGAELLRRELPRYLRGELPAAPQDATQATTAPLLRKEHGEVRWDAPAWQVHDLVRGMHPWPGAYTFLDGTRVKLHRASPARRDGAPAPAGSVLACDARGIEVACGEGSLRLLEVQPEAGKRMTAAAFAAGQRLSPGARFSSSPEAMSQ